MKKTMDYDCDDGFSECFFACFAVFSLESHGSFGFRGAAEV